MCAAAVLVVTRGECRLAPGDVVRASGWRAVEAPCRQASQLTLRPLSNDVVIRESPDTSFAAAMSFIDTSIGMPRVSRVADTRVKKIRQATRCCLP